MADEQHPPPDSGGYLRSHDLLPGAALLFAPRWFYTAIGTFPPFNRHYQGDLGSFLLPLGIGLVVAAPDPFKHLLLIRIAVIATLLHTLNHTYDAMLVRAPLGCWLSDTLPLLVVAVLLLLVERWSADPRAQRANLRDRNVCLC